MVYASAKPFEAGVVLTVKDPDNPDHVTDRFVHPFPLAREDAAAFARIEKRTLVIETRAK